MTTSIEIASPRPTLFLCRRTSAYADKPCEEAFLVYMPPENRAVHAEWAVEITECMAFVEAHGKCVFGIDKNGFNTVEIYDDYRE